ncbi:MAG: 30S ribosomal protein S26e [Nitrososphaeria archaeon]
MTKKRKSRGRSKGDRGRSDLVHCSKCGALVPRDKAIKVTARHSPVDPVLAKELREKGSYVPITMMTKYYCISCAVHYGIVKVRPENERKEPGRLSRR